MRFWVKKCHTPPSPALPGVLCEAGGVQREIWAWYRDQKGSSTFSKGANHSILLLLQCGSSIWMGWRDPGRAGHSHVVDQSRNRNRLPFFLYLYVFCLIIALLICARDRIIIMLNLIILTQLFPSNNPETTAITKTTATGFFNVCEKMGDPKP